MSNAPRGTLRWFYDEFIEAERVAASLNDLLCQFADDQTSGNYPVIPGGQTPHQEMWNDLTYIARRADQIKRDLATIRTHIAQDMLTVGEPFEPAAPGEGE